MQVTKKFHFYAAHRNEEIGGKCAALHGHKYELYVTTESPRNGSVTILFEDIEKKAAPIIDAMDHSLLLNVNDPSAKILAKSGACSKIYFVPFVTSAENMAEHLLAKLKQTGLNVVELILRETDSSSVRIKA